MTDRYVGPGGNDGNSGLTWPLRKLTLTGMEASPPVAGDDIHAGPGVYREMLITGVAGGNVYNAGTVTVTNGSTTVTGVGTAFLANVAAAYMFQVRYFASGNDGVANGTATFTSAAGNFQAGMVGKVIQINTRGAYGIGAVAAANSITLTDPNGLGWPAAAVGLNYSVMSGEGPYEIDSVTDNTNFELVRPWCGPTLTGLAYETYNPIRYIADVTGENTDGVGGVVRVTGSDNDQTIVRGTGIHCDRNYRIFRGFRIDMTNNYGFRVSDAHDVVVEDCFFSDHTNNAFFGNNVSLANITIRRCIFMTGGNYTAASFWHSATVDDTNCIVENCIVGGSRGWGAVRSDEVGGITVKNCLGIGGHQGVVRTVTALTVGQSVVVENCVFQGNYQGVAALVLGEIVENYNTYWNNLTDRVNTGIGANSVTYPALFASPILHSGQNRVSGYEFPYWLYELSEWSQVRALAGSFEPCGDLRGFGRPGTSSKKSWGPLQFCNMERDTTTVFAGTASMEISDAGRIQFKVPTTNRRYTIRVWVQREANYAGVNPQLVIKQPGQADRTTTDAGAAGAWNLLEDSFVPAALPPYLFIELVSNNTAAAGNYAVYFDRLTVRGSPLDTGEMEQWLWDRQPFEDYGKVTPVVKKSVQGDEVFVEINTRGDLLKVAP